MSSEPTPDALIRGHSVTARTAFRLLATSVVVPSGLVASIVVARRLGPEEKAVVSALSFLIALGVPLAGMGAGEASIFLIRGRAHPLRDALQTVSAAVLAASAAVAAALFGAGYLLFQHDWDTARGAVIAAAVALPTAALMISLSHVVEAQERALLTSACRALAAVVTGVGTVVAVMALDAGVAGAGWAMAAGWSAGLGLLVIALGRDGLSVIPRIDRRFLRSALSLGRPLQAGGFLVIAATRLDLLIVAAISGSRPAGLYSVALTAGQILSYASGALVVAAQPRVASMAATSSPRSEIERVMRVAVAASLLLAAILIAIIPVALPRLFGAGFQDAVPSAMALVVAGVLYSSRTTLASLLAAAGSTGSVAASHGTAVVVMVLADLALVPAFGILGASVAAISASAAGWLAVWPRYKSAFPEARFGALMPGKADVLTIGTQLWSIPRLVTNSLRRS